MGQAAPRKYPAKDGIAQFPTLVGVREARALGYDGPMPDPLTSLVLVLALAAGLGAAIVVAQHVETGPAQLNRYLLTHILLFNLLILSGLVFRFLQPQSQFGPAAVLLMLLLMTSLKLGWLFSFGMTTRLLSRRLVSKRTASGAAKVGLALFACWSAVAGMAWFGALPRLLNASLAIIEIIVLGGALLAAALLLRDALRMPRGELRQSAVLFGGFHLVLLVAVSVALLASWVRPGPAETMQLLFNGAFLLLFNLFPPLWIRRYRPAYEQNTSQRFEAFAITPRERQVIGLIQAGKTNREIADALFISVATVKDHNNNLFRKCGVRNRVELANLFR
jgi:DNA-binding CsgD family transcriptional regulator